MKHGPTLSVEAFNTEVAKLYDGVNTRRIPTDVLRKEMDLTVDHRLGVWFPRERRNHLWIVTQRINDEYSRLGRVKLIFYWLVSFVSPSLLMNKIDAMSKFVIAELEAALTREELIAFAGEDESYEEDVDLDESPV